MVLFSFKRSVMAGSSFWGGSSDFLLSNPDGNQPEGLLSTANIPWHTSLMKSSDLSSNWTNHPETEKYKPSHPTVGTLKKMCFMLPDGKGGVQLFHNSEIFVTRNTNKTTPTQAEDNNKEDPKKDEKSNAAVFVAAVQGLHFLAPLKFFSLDALSKSVQLKRKRGTKSDGKPRQRERMPSLDQFLACESASDAFALLNQSKGLGEEPLQAFQDGAYFQVVPPEVFLVIHSCGGDVGTCISELAVLYNVRIQKGLENTEDREKILCLFHFLIGCHDDLIPVTSETVPGPGTSLSKNAGKAHQENVQEVFQRFGFIAPGQDFETPDDTPNPTTKHDNVSNRDLEGTKNDEDLDVSSGEERDKRSKTASRSVDFEEPNQSSFDDFLSSSSDEDDGVSQKNKRARLSSKKRRALHRKEDHESIQDLRNSQKRMADAITFFSTNQQMKGMTKSDDEKTFESKWINQKVKLARMLRESSWVASDKLPKDMSKNLREVLSCRGPNRAYQLASHMLQGHSVVGTIIKSVFLSFLSTGMIADNACLLYTSPSPRD